MPRKARDIPWVDARDGVYYVFWYDPKRGRTERRSLGTRDAGEAQARFAAFLAQGREVYAGRPDGLTVDDALDSYELEHVNKKVVDKDRAIDIIRNLKAHFAGVLVRDVDIPKCRDYVLARGMGLIGSTGRGKDIMAGSPATCRRELGLLKAAAAHAVRWKRLPPGEVPQVELPPNSEPVTRWLTHEELAALRAACGATGRLRWFVEIAYYTASRRDAVETLTKFQVDMDRGRISLAKQGEVRTKKRRPVVPIDPQLRPWLAAALEESKTEFVLGSAQPLYKAFMAAAAKAGLTDDVTPHVLRHTRATHLLQSGAAPWAVANLLGDTLTTVQKVYGHACPDYLAEVLSGEAKAGDA